MKIYKKCTAEKYSFLVNDTILKQILYPLQIILYVLEKIF